MPEIGEIKIAREIGEIKIARDIGYQNLKWWQKYVYHACIDCGKGRWVQIQKGNPVCHRCRSCSKKGEHHPYYGTPVECHSRWKGGHSFCDGYIMIFMPEHPRASYGYIKRAVLVLEKKLGRFIQDGYDVHHINGIQDDDTPENLEEQTHSNHARLHAKNRTRNIFGQYNEPILAIGR